MCSTPLPVSSSSSPATGLLCTRNSSSACSRNSMWSGLGGWQYMGSGGGRGRILNLTLFVHHKPKAVTTDLFRRGRKLTIIDVYRQALESELPLLAHCQQLQVTVAHPLVQLRLHMATDISELRGQDGDVTMCDVIISARENIDRAYQNTTPSPTPASLVLTGMQATVMFLEDLPEIARSFLEWTLEDVLQWLSTLSLSRDYSSQFREHNINGATLLKLKPATLDELSITDAGDRVKLLQNITSMRADLVTTPSSMKLGRSPLRARRFSEAIIHKPSRRGGTPHAARHRASASALERGASLSPTKMYRGATSPSKLERFDRDSPPSSVESSRMGSPVKLHPGSQLDSRRHYVLETEAGLSNGLRAMVTLRDYQKKRLSRSMDGLMKELDALYPPPSQQDGSSRLVEILREENSSLKKELESYYQRVRRLQKLEQEVERIRESHRLLEASSSRREALEGAVRARLEQELQKSRETCLQQKAELHAVRKQGPNSSSKNEGRRRKEIVRRDTMIMRLIKQNKDAAVVREQLEKDLHSTKAALKERKQTDGGEGPPLVADTQDHRPSPEVEARAAVLYSESIEKLHQVLAAMQNMSQKRERLEKRLRSQLSAEIRELRGEKGAGPEGEGAGTEDCQLQSRVVTLEADVAKWEHKCLELVAERQMALEAAVIPRDLQLSQLERALTEKEDMLQELSQQRLQHVAQLSEAGRTVADLETMVASQQASLKEKDAMLQVMQASLLEPEGCSPDDFLYPSRDSPAVHKKPFNGSLLSLNSGSSAASSTGEIPTHFSPSPPTKQRELGHSGGYVTNGVLFGHGMYPHLNGNHTDCGLPLTNSHGPNTRYLGPAHSSSAPNTPRTRRPRVSHPNMVMASDVGTSSAPSSIHSSPASHKRRMAKSRTPPPNYHIVGSSRESREKRRSVDGLLDGTDHTPCMIRHQSSQDNLFDSLLSNGLAPQLHVAGHTHRHSKSSPSSHKLL